MSTIQSSTLTVNAWQRASAAVQAALRSTLLFNLLLFPLTFLELLLHEGGHGLVHIFHGEKITLFYVHPFAFNGYVRATNFLDTAVNHAAGVILLMLVSLIVFILVWKRRSPATLPLVMLFPWAAWRSGMAINSLANHSGDYYNITRVSDVPAAAILIPGILLLLTGLFFLLALLPLLGLNPKNLWALVVLPGGYLLWKLTGSLVASLLVPGSPADIIFRLREEILHSARMNPTFNLMVWLGLGVIFVTLFRWLSSRLPAALRTEAVRLTWKDLRWPAAWALGCLALGLWFIT